MADAVVQFFIEKLSSILEQEAFLLSGVRDEAEFMRDELQRMNAFLEVSETGTETDPQLKVWVDQVRDVAYDTEDLLDKFIIRLTHRPGNGLYSNLRRICFYLKNLKARHQIASEIQRLKSRVEGIAKGNQRYKDSNIPQQSNTTTNHNRPIPGLPPIVKVRYVGIDAPKHKLASWLVEGGSAGTRKCISLVGMGGCGKTTLADQVYRQVHHHFDSHVSLVISQSYDFKVVLVKLIKGLYEDINQPCPPGVDEMDKPPLLSMIAKFLMEKRYVIVMDDVWKVEHWEELSGVFPENNRGSRLMLTTRLHDVAKRSKTDTNGYSYCVKPLSQAAAWDLLCHIAFQDACCPHHLKDVCQRILRKCDHLPLAIVTIGGVLATKDQRIGDWETFYRSFPYELEGDGKLKGLLSGSYDDLPNYLKISYLYMHMFPEDVEIERMRLIRLWIGEGLVQVREGMTMEEVADRYLEELVNRSLIQVAKFDDRGRRKILRIHDVLREVLLSKAREHKIVTKSSPGSNNLWPDKVRRLACHDTIDISQKTSRYFYSLRSLVILRDPSSLTKSKLPAIVSSCTLLKVLDLRGVELEVVPKNIFDLIHLRCLSLRGIGLRKLSKKIGKLQHLEMLDLKQTHITVLPDEILSLRHLCHLLVYSYDDNQNFRPFDIVKECKVPSNIGKLELLQKLCYIDASNNIIVKELGLLRQLRRLGVCKLRREDGNALCTSLSNLTNLRSLYIQSQNEEEELDVNSSSLASLPHLETLSLVGHFHRAPMWIESLQNLVNIRLWGSKLSEEPLNFLHNLPNLRTLDLAHAYEGEGLHFESRSFRRLRKLLLQSLKELRRITIAEHSMPELEQLYIWDCESMDELPLGMQHLTKLQELQILDMPIVEGFKEKGKEYHDYFKKQYVPRVFYGYVKDERKEFYLL